MLFQRPDRIKSHFFNYSLFVKEMLNNIFTCYSLKKRLHSIFRATDHRSVSLFVLRFSTAIKFLWLAHICLFLAQGQEEMYECYAYTGPHVYTWHPKSVGLLQKDYQDCYAPGFYPIVDNNFVYYKMKISKKWMIEVLFHSYL